MKVKKIIWKERLGTLGPIIFDGFVGRLPIFTTGWSVISHSDRELPYTLHCNLINLKQTRFKIQEEAKKYANKVLEELVKEFTEEN